MASPYNERSRKSSWEKRFAWASQCIADPPTAIVRDITARKRVEEEIRRINEDLENRVAQRTKQLEERERRLRESEVRYRSFVEQSREGIWRFELEEPVPTDLAPDEQVE